MLSSCAIVFLCYRLVVLSSCCAIVLVLCDVTCVIVLVPLEQQEHVASEHGAS